jgi:hypothetical protein
LWQIDYAPSFLPHAYAEIGVLRTIEDVLVEIAHGLKSFAAYELAGSYEIDRFQRLRGRLKVV